MKVIRLRYRDQANAIDRILDLARPLRDKVEGESEEVLTVWIAADGTIEGIAPPKRCKLRAAVEVGDRPRQGNQVPEHIGKLIDDVLRRALETHGVK